MSGYKPTRDPSGFFILKGPGPPQIWIESDRIEECMAYYRANGFSRIGVSSQMGYHLPDLEFLEAHPYVHGVGLPEANRLDLSGLRHLLGLEYLLLSESKQPFDVAQFERLEELRATWHPKLHISSDCKRLRTLALWKYKPKAKDLTELPLLPELEDLSLVQAPLSSILGVGRYQKLRRLELSYLAKLVSIDGVRELTSSSLEILECEKCRSVEDHAAVGAVSSLRVLRFNDCGTIPSIGFLEDLPLLEDFRFVNTNVLDGDLRPLLRLKSAGFFKKKHYSHTPEEVDKILASNAASKSDA